MKTVSLKACMAALCVALLPTLAMAGPMGSQQDVARDQSGKAVMDARGNCVLTQWASNTDSCAHARLDLSREELTIYFDFNKKSLKASERAKLDHLIKVIKQSKSVESVDIIGHADRIGGSSYNQKLSAERAKAVKKYLAGHGGIRTRNIDVKAVGSSEPVAECSSNESRDALIKCLAEDRRVEISLNYAK